jgi:hypothetical protein
MTYRPINSIISAAVAASVAATNAPILEARLRVVESSPGANEILGPVAANTPITIPDSITYEDKELNVFFDGQKLIPEEDYVYVGLAPRTQIELTFDLVPGDLLFFEKERNN